ncbi:MAG: ferredoxin reductase family protein [Anaerolineae bacterium]
MSNYTKKVICLLLFVLITILPVLLMLLAPRPAGRQLWRDAAVALGFLGLALMGWQFVPTVRLGWLTDIFNLDALYNVHHAMSRLSFYLVLAHPVLLLLGNPYNFVAFNVISGAWRLRAGVFAFTLMIFLVGTSVWRQWLRLGYEIWHGLHDVLAVAVVGFALYHILNVNYYTSLPVQQALWVVYGVVWAAMILWIRVVTPFRLLQRPYELVDVIEERGNTWTLEFAPVDHEGLRFRAGQAAWLTIDESPFGLNAHPLSFTSSAERSERVSFSIRELGDWSSKVGTYPVGTRAYIDGPYGTFDLAHHPGSRYVFIAGGIGSAPIMSMLRTMADRGDDRQLHFFYGNRDWESITFREELDALEKRLDLEVVHVLENPPETWEGETGFISGDVMRRHIGDCAECVYFICGPLPMINFVKKELHKLEVPKEHIHRGLRELVLPQSRVYAEEYEMA